MAINAIIDGVTYSGVDTILTGGKTVGLSVDSSGGNISELIDGTISAVSDADILNIRSSAFTYLSDLRSAEFANVRTIGANAFQYCSWLAHVSAPMCESMGGYAFMRCFRLAEISLPLLTSINGDSAFFEDSALITVNMPLLISVPKGTFSGCNVLSSVNIEKAQTIGVQAFAFNAIEMISLPECVTISAQAFFRCPKLLSVYLMGSSIVTLKNSDAFQWTPIDGSTSATGGVLGSIYVPASLLTDYQAASNWSYYSSRIVGI